MDPEQYEKDKGKSKEVHESEAKESFKPNPEAPAWDPSKVSVEKGKGPAVSRQESHTGPAVGGPSHWSEELQLISQAPLSSGSSASDSSGSSRLLEAPPAASSSKVSPSADGSPKASPAAESSQATPKAGSSKAGPSGVTPPAAKSSEAGPSKAAAPTTGSARVGSGAGPSGKTILVANTTSGFVHNPGDESETTIARHKEHWSVDDITDAVDHLYSVCKGYIVNCHNPGELPTVPYEYLQTMEPATWSYICSLIYADPHQAAAHLTYLFSITMYRPYVVLRVCLDYFFKKILSPDIFLGFSTELDAHLAALQQEMAMCNTSDQPEPRQRIIDQHARIIAHLIQSPGFDAFQSNVINGHSVNLAQILKPMRSCKLPEDDVLKAVRCMVDVAFTISCKVWSSSVTLNFSFPECGVRYAFGTMHAFNANHMGIPDERILQFNHYRVSFIMSPTLSVRDDRGITSKTSGIRKADVLVMK